MGVVFLLVTLTIAIHVAGQTRFALSIQHVLGEAIFSGTL